MTEGGGLFNTNMRKAGVDKTVIMKLTGHKTLSMFARYNTVDQDDAVSALKNLDRFLAKEKSVKSSDNVQTDLDEQENGKPEKSVTI